MLQGEGITLILDGQTDIKKGITTSTFNAVPDAPVSSFETTLPEGPHSALTSNVPESKDFSLCGQKLTMPTTITAQNGAVITQQTKIPVLGCGAVAGVKFTRSQKLAKALKKCRREFRHSKKRRGPAKRRRAGAMGSRRRLWGSTCPRRSDWARDVAEEARALGVRALASPLSRLSLVALGGLMTRGLASRRRTLRNRDRSSTLPGEHRGSMPTRDAELVMKGAAVWESCGPAAPAPPVSGRRAEPLS